MGLKLVGGSAKGRKLKGPKKAGIRPASARVRKSLFSILGDLEAKHVLDLFAGTGSMGLEALSQGAGEVTFVDQDPQAIQLIFHNLKKTGWLDRTYILKEKALAAIHRLGRMGRVYDIIFVDPPYDQDLINPALKKISQVGLLAETGVILCEHSPREKVTFLGRLKVVDVRKYGQTLVTFLKK